MKKLNKEKYSKDDIIDFLSESLFSLRKELERKETIILQQEETLKLHDKLNELEKEADNVGNGW